MTAIGTLPAHEAKALAERLGARAVSYDKRRGGTYMVISAIRNGHRETRDVPVVNGAVAAASFRHAVSMALGPVAARYV